MRFPIDGWDEGKPLPRHARPYKRLANRLRGRDYERVAAAALGSRTHISR
jgi:hypothetical protein